MMNDLEKTVDESLPVDRGRMTRDQVELIKRTVAVDVTDDELAMFLYQAKRTGLDPLARQIHMIKRGGRATIQTGIDGYRATADRTGNYAGSDDYLFDDGLSEYQCIAKGRNRPTTATVTVFKMVHGQRVSFSATARWEEYYPGEAQGFMWGKMPFLMLGKCAEALALRKAFPQELSGVYTHEEMEQVRAIDAEPVTPPPAKTQRKTRQNPPQEPPGAAKAASDMFEADDGPQEQKEGNNEAPWGGPAPDPDSPTSGDGEGAGPLEDAFLIEVSGKEAFNNKAALMKQGFAWEEKRDGTGKKGLCLFVPQEHAQKWADWAASLEGKPIVRVYNPAGELEVAINDKQK